MSFELLSLVRSGIFFFPLGLWVRPSQSPFAMLFGFLTGEGNFGLSPDTRPNFLNGVLLYSGGLKRP